MMNIPTADDIGKGKDLNRYEVAVAVAKGAHIVTDDYLRVRAHAEDLINEKKTEKSLHQLISERVQDIKPVSDSISHIQSGDYVIDKTVERRLMEQMAIENDR